MACSLTVCARRHHSSKVQLSANCISHPVLTDLRRETESNFHRKVDMHLWLTLRFTVP